MKMSDQIKERIAESLASWVENDLEMILDDVEPEIDCSNLRHAFRDLEIAMSDLEAAINTLDKPF